MNGCVIPGTSIAVDFWQAQKHPGIRLFFLTHIHGDHVVGLTSTWQRPIYCSPLTAQLLMERYGISRSVLRPLEEGQTHIVGYCQSRCPQAHGQATSSGMKQLSVPETWKPMKRKDRSCDSMSVTVINANHCPGAVMFLFEGSFGKILHTGDFRFHPEMVEESSLLFKHIGSIDRLYLDNTYCSPKCVFPSRQEALEEIVDIVKRHSDHDIVFGIRDLGKEQLLAAVALALGESVNVSARTLSVASALGFPNVFQTGQPDLRVRVAPFRQISSEFIRRLNTKKPTIVILPTALYHGICGKPYANQPKVFVVPFSDHSSFPELVQFVSKLKPACVVPIVCGKVRGPFGVDVSSREDMNCFQPYLSKTQNSHPASLISSPADRLNPLCIYTKALLSDEQNHSHPKTKSNGFEDLFPDFQRPSSKRKKPTRKRPRKQLCPKGVNYLSDDADKEKGVEEVSSTVEKNNNVKSNAIGEQKTEMTDGVPETDLNVVTQVLNQEKVDTNDQDSVIYVENFHNSSQGNVAKALNRQELQQGESCVRNIAAVCTKKVAPVFHNSIATDSNRASLISNRHQSISQETEPDSMGSSAQRSAKSKHSPVSLTADSATPEDHATSPHIFGERSRGDSPSKAQVPMNVHKCCLSAAVQGYLAYIYNQSAAETSAERHAKLMQTFSTIFGLPRMKKLKQ